MTRRTTMAPARLPFVDLAAQQRRIGDRIERAIARVLAHGQYILGPEVQTLEAELARFCGAGEVVSCGNGTDALALVLMAKSLTRGQAVLCPSFTFAATAEAVAWLGATPVFVDVDPAAFNIDATSLEIGIATAKQRGLHPVGVIAVDLFGQPADYDALERVCGAHGLWLLADAAQSFGAAYKGRQVGTFGSATTTSFYPSKPLGCYGDGGAIFTNDAELAATLRSLRVHGQGVDKYDNVRIGMNGRLDTIQAAVLIEKLKVFADEMAARNTIAARYGEALADVATVPRLAEGRTSVWAQYTIKVEPDRRAALAERLKGEGIPTEVHYARALHQQTAYRDCPIAGNGLPVCEALVRQVISLPMHAYLAPGVQDRIVDAVRRALR
jgi:UDP-2-acetamido-2-deoxy-ribo-hexuluronate aminotransferase